VTVASEQVVKRARGFTLEALPEEPDSYAFRLREVAIGGAGRSALTLRVKASRARRVMGSMLEAAKASGHVKSALAFHRTRDVTLTEEAGVRLALVLLTTGPVGKSRRVVEIAQAIAGMGTEEAYYWYAQCVGRAGRRARRALRLLLADE
jgi:hypothetical protein